MIPWWRYDEEQAVARAMTFEELAPIALAVAARMPQPLGMVCGPITSGGLAEVKANLERFDRAVQYVRSSGLSVFSQLPFEDALFRIEATPYCQGREHLLQTFYGPLFASGMLRVAYFIPEWATSQGAVWEREQASRLGMCILEIPVERLS